MAIAASVLCLTMTLFKEAESEKRVGMIAVGDTVITRVIEDKRPDVCSVILDDKQFSWTINLKSPTLPALMDYQDETLSEIGSDERRVNSYRKAEGLARKMLRSGYKRSYRFYHFSRCDSRPYWSRGKVTKIGHHCFERRHK